MNITGEDFLTTILTLGMRTTSEMRRLSKEYNISWGQIEKGRKTIGVVFKKVGFPAKTLWSLPGEVDTTMRAYAELKVSLWEYYLLTKKASGAHERLEALDRVCVVIKKYGGVI